MTRLAINVATVLATLTGLAVVWEFRGVALIFCMSLALAAAVRPAIGFFIDRHFPVTLAVAATYLPLLGIVGLLVWLSASRLSDEFDQMANDSVRAYEQIDRSWHAGNWIQQEIARSLPTVGTTGSLQQSGWELKFVRTLFGLTLSLAGIIFDGLLIIVMSIYWSLDRVHFERLWLSLLSASTRISARHVWRAIETELGRYLRSEFFQSLLAGLLLGLGYWLIGAPYPVVLALVGAAAWLIPWVGVLFAVLALTVASLPALITQFGWHSMLVFGAATLYTCLLLLLLEVLVEPRFFDRRRYSAVLTAFVAISLAMVWGIFGLLIGPPLAVVLQVLGSHLLRRRLGLSDETAPSSADVAARLAALRQSLSESQPPRPELINLVERLSAIMEQARPELHAAGASAGDKSRFHRPSRPPAEAIGR